MKNPADRNKKGKICRIARRYCFTVPEVQQHGCHYEVQRHKQQRIVKHGRKPAPKTSRR
jgi:hypothetical protein